MSPRPDDESELSDHSTRDAGAQDDDSRENDGERAGLAKWFLPGLWLLFFLLTLGLFAPLQNATWLSDDWSVIAQNPYIQELTLENLRIIFEPFGPSIAHAMNYSPVHLLFHGVELQMFGTNMPAYHFVAALLHATSTLLLVALLMASGVSRNVAAAAGLVFLVHPANAEAVALIFQAKTTLSTALAFGALLAFWRRPALAALLFALALLTKFSAAFALPTVLAMFWARSGGRGPGAPVLPHWGWLAVWASLLVLVAVPEFHAFERMGQAIAPLGDDLGGRVRSIVAISGRYLVMAAIGYGVSNSHQTGPAESWLDPWWLFGLMALALLGARLVYTLRQRREEAAWWLLAAGAFAPVCQVFPFLFPMADRYLYTVLPGLIGGGLLMAAGLARRFGTRLDGLRERGFARVLQPAGAASLLVVIAAGFGLATWQRVPVFRTESRMFDEAADNYPDGILAWLRRADRAAARSDPREAAAALEAARVRGFTVYALVLSRPALQPVIQHPEVRAVLARMADYWIERLEPIEEPYQIERYNLGQALVLRGEVERGIEVLEAALAQGGRHDDVTRQALKEARVMRMRGVRR